MPRGIYPHKPYMKNRGRLTPEIRQRILRARECGFAMWAIGEALRLSRTTISKVLKEERETIAMRGSLPPQIELSPLEVYLLGAQR